MSGDCWVWQGKTNGGYGSLIINSKIIRAHRYSWEMANGPIPGDLKVLHTCDNPPCVNPAHLFLGTNADNTADMVAKGRSTTGMRNGLVKHPERAARGSAHGSAKLNEDTVREIRAARAAGESLSELSHHFEISPTTIIDVAKRKTWKHVT